MNRFSIFASLLFALLSNLGCSKYASTEELVRSWIGKDMVFLHDAVYTIHGDTVQYNPSINDFNILVYFESEGCDECRLRLSAWKSFMTEINRYVPNVGLSFVIKDMDASTIAQVTKRNDFCYPVLSITENIYEFPENPLYQVFLLDDSNRVLAVGNPIDIESIECLYRNIMNLPDKLSEINDAVPNLIFSDKKIPLGVIHHGEMKKASIFIKNRSDSIAVISKIIPSCECTTVSTKYDTIMPQQIVKLDVLQINDSSVGQFVRDINLYFNNNPEPVQIELTGFMSTH